MRWCLQKPSINNPAVQILIMIDRKIRIRTIVCNIYNTIKGTFFLLRFDFVRNDYGNFFVFFKMNFFQWFKYTVFKNSIYYFRHNFTPSYLNVNLYIVLFLIYTVLFVKIYPIRLKPLVSVSGNYH